MGLVGTVKKMEVDKDGKASGAYLRARVAIDIAKPLRRGVMLKTRREANPEWFHLQYEKLPFFCFACGVMGHSELECVKEVARDSAGKLPYDVKLRAPEVKKKKLQSFAEAAAEQFGGGSSAGPKQPRGSVPKEGDKKEPGSDNADNEEEVQPPLKPSHVQTDGLGTSAARHRSKEKEEDKSARKRKAKGYDPNPTGKPSGGAAGSASADVVPVGLVSARVQELGQGGSTEVTGVIASEVSPKKQKRGNTTTTARSAAAASSSPRRAQ